MAGKKGSLHFLLRAVARQTRTHSGGPPRKALPPQVEVLEDRTLLSFPPVLMVPGPFSVVKTTQLVVPVTATDRDAKDTLTFSLGTDAPAGAAISSGPTTPGPNGVSATGTLTWTPTPDQGPANFTFTISVTDTDKPQPSTVSQKITVTTLAAGLVGNNLLIVGTNGADTVSVNAPSAANSLSVTVNGATTGPFTMPPGGQVQANLWGGNDTFTLNESPQLVSPPLVVDGGAGVNTLIDNGTAGADAFTITAAKVSLPGAGDLSYLNFQALAVNGLAGNDTVTMTGINPATATTVDGGPGAENNTFTGNFAQTFSGTLTLANFQNATLSVQGDLNGSFAVNAPGLLQQLSVTGNVTGTVTATNVSAATIGTLSGMMTASGGNISAAQITAITSTGVLKATETGPGTGTISNSTIGSNAGTITAGALSGLAVSLNAAGGVIRAQGQGTASGVSIGTNAGSFSTVEDGTSGSGVMSNTTIDNNSGSVSAGSISGMAVGSNSGSITASGQGTITDVSININSGALTAKPDNVPGSGALSNVNIGTLTASATLTAGHFNIVTAKHSAAVVNFFEPTVTRTLQVTSHVANGATTGGALPSDYGFYYDGTGGGNPRVTIQVAGGTSGVSYDLGVLTDTVGVAGSGFDLAGLYVTSGQAGIQNIVVGGDLVPGGVTAAGLAFFGLPSTTPGGVQLPQDTVAVAVAGKAPAASIATKSVVALAAGSFGTVSADAALNTDALVPLAAGTTLAQATDNYSVFAGEANHVAQFLVTGPGGSFDAKKMLFADQVNDNRPITAKDFLVPSGSSTSVSEVDFTGKGGSLTTAQPILTTIQGAPGATLADLILGAPQGITANITADSILGNIDATNGAISGVIQTTVGDIGRALTDASGTIITGVTFIHTGGGGLTSTGKIVSAGNLVSQINLKSGLDGVIGAGGDLGVIQLTNGLAPQAPAALTRFGGIVVSTGGLNGQVVVLGNVFGDLSITGGLSGRIAVHGKEEFGLSTGANFGRTGILGNVSIGGGISATGAIVSAGLIGDDGSGNIKNDTKGTHLTISGTDKGIIAAGEDINFGATGGLNTAGTFENVGPGDSSPTPSNANVINWIFTNGGSTLPIADVLLGPQSLILQDLIALTVGSDGNLTGTKR
jgi:hypothetical protein